MIYGEALEDLQCLYSGGVSKAGHRGSAGMEDVTRWAAAGNCTIATALDSVAVGLARDYAAGILTWEFCDHAANNLFGVWVNLEHADAQMEASKFWEFYLAFDDSEMAPEGEEDRAARENIAAFLTQQDIGPA